MRRIKKDNNQGEGKEQEIKASTRALKRSTDRVKRKPMKEVVELQQTDGKLYNKHNVRGIDDLLGITSGTYNTHDLKDYEKQLHKMNISDLQRHAISVGVMPKDDRRLLVKLLIKQFQVVNSAYSNVAENVQPTPKKISQETLDILAEGR